MGWRVRLKRIKGVISACGTAVFWQRSAVPESRVAGSAGAGTMRGRNSLSPQIAVLLGPLEQRTLRLATRALEIVQRKLHELLFFPRNYSSVAGWCCECWLRRHVHVLLWACIATPRRARRTLCKAFTGRLVVAADNGRLCPR